MVEKSVTIRECDVCGSGDGVEAFIIDYAGTLVRVDLCEEHGEPVKVAHRAGRRPAGSQDKDRPQTRAAFERQIIDE